MGRQYKGFRSVGYMLKQGCSIPEHILLSILDRCADLDACRSVHYSMCISCPGSACVSGPLIRSLASLHSLLDVNLVFCQVSDPTVHTWQAIIYAHLENGENAHAIEFYYQMVASVTQPNRFVFSCVLRACASISDFLNGMLVHEHIITCGLHDDVIVGSSLIDMYAKCGIMMSARKVFDRLRNCNTVSWNALINGYVRNEECHKALRLFQTMQMSIGTLPNKVTFLCAMKACGEVEDTKQGRGVHDKLIMMGLDSDLNITNTLIDMYANCNCMTEAFYVFHNMPIRTVVSWTAIINGAARFWNGLSVMLLYDQMVREGFIPDRVILIGLLNACAHAKCIERGSHIHDQILERGFGADLIVRGALIDMYAKCNMLNDARRVFDATPTKSLMIWGLMITGYGQHGEGTAALELYEKMMECGVKPDKVLFSALLNVCGNLGALEQGKALHGQMSDCQVEPDTVVENTLIDMYIKCGDVEKACEVFDGLPYRDDVSWHVMLSSHARQHIGQGAIQCYRNMQQSRICSNEPFYAGVVSACRLDQGQLQFSPMTSVDPVSSIMCHYTSVVETLACIGRLEMATGIPKSMPTSPSAIHWISLLSRCRVHGTLQLAQHFLSQIIQLGPPYDPLSKVCLDAYMWNRAGMHKLSNVSETTCGEKPIDGFNSLVNNDPPSVPAEFDSAMECKHAPEPDSYYRELLENYKKITLFKDHYLEDCFYFNLASKRSSKFITRGLREQIEVW